jgi:hypothetical protein
MANIFLHSAWRIASAHRDVGEKVLGHAVDGGQERASNIPVELRAFCTPVIVRASETPIVDRAFCTSETQTLGVL